MPNALGHLGAQGLLTRALIKDADIKWICAGAVLPDVPWILHRLLRPLIPPESILDARLYFLVQGSFVFCLLLAAAAAILSSNPRIVFRILGINVVLHLLLDAAQIRWAEGVHLLAPFSWESTRFDLFWPESVVGVVVTVTGLVFVPYAWFVRRGTPIAPSPRSSRSVALSAAFLLAYFLLPPLFVARLENSDAMYFAALRGDVEREGRAVGFDRVHHFEEGGSREIESITGERFELRGVTGEPRGRLTLKGRFRDSHTIQVQMLHEHWPWFRDAATYAGLLLAALVWLGSLASRRGRRPDGSTGPPPPTPAG